MVTIPPPQGICNSPQTTCVRYVRINLDGHLNVISLCHSINTATRLHCFMKCSVLFKASLACFPRIFFLCKKISEPLSFCNDVVKGKKFIGLFELVQTDEYHMSCSHSFTYMYQSCLCLLLSRDKIGSLENSVTFFSMFNPMNLKFKIVRIYSSVFCSNTCKVILI